MTDTSQPYRDRNIVITGGSTGFGLATARLLTDGGARVMITGRNQEALAAAQASLGDAAIAVGSDAASLPDIEALATRVKGEFGTLDGLFANAGISGFAPFLETSKHMFEQLLSINTLGPYFTVQKLAPHLAPGSGVVLTTSVANTLGLPMLSAYSAGKAAVRAMARGLGRELLPQGIRVNAISPGPIDSGVLAKSMPPEVAAQTESQMAADNPMQRMGSVDEIAKAVVFLLFDATYTTGAELVVDGGGSQL
ncbi:SDR family oxidoreductase [Mycolicibacterium setense]|uniref:SDR family oxidoreductase n=1 Tax=Mycolicibacterium setense TaxID=431269 RepID=UPI00057445CD|nr:SDR family oxidoreductase [Mycolicibacterium setense]KHO22070.1 short-chain dehydrogenase [Mycolicibacterium setense]